MDVSKLASLARIKLTKEEEEELSLEFSAILAYVDQIKAVNVEDEIEYGAEKTDLINIMREDDENNPTGKMTNTLLDLAPERQGDYIKVKKIL